VHLRRKWKSDLFCLRDSQLIKKHPNSHPFERFIYRKIKKSHFCSNLLRLTANWSLLISCLSLKNRTNNITSLFGLMSLIRQKYDSKDHIWLMLMMLVQTFRYYHFYIILGHSRSLILINLQLQRQLLKCFEFKAATQFLQYFMWILSKNFLN